jgi:Heterokaryon incompatibility protein (HET)
MRLINVLSMEMEEHFGDGSKLPKYAILSHRWLNEEVSFRDYQLRAYANMRGYKKIQYTCEQAKKDGLNYAWIDTCCIDKTSSSELSEAINSMFNWYRWAQVCYVYLEDLSDEYLERSKDPAFSFRWCRWFKRGWTLQELLAPEQVLFYGNKWRYVGSKQSLAQEIAQTTGIPILALRNREFVPVYSIAAKMSWAASRSTSRTEDRAYCLLGIFGVNMPLLYGEGEKAFERLQEELVKISDDETLFSWGGTGAAETRILARSPSDFHNGGHILAARLGHWKMKRAVEDSHSFDQDGYHGSRQHFRQKNPYSLTKSGLRIDLPLILTKDLGRYALRHDEHGPEEPDVLGVLQCRKDSDPVGSYIALPLLETTTPGIYRRSRFRHITVSAEDMSNAQMHCIYIQGSQPSSEYPVYWCEIACSGLVSPTITPIYNKSFTNWNAKRLRAEASTLLSKQTKVVMEFYCTISAIDISFVLVLDVDLMTKQQTITLHPMSVQEESRSYMERYEKSQRDLYGESRNVPAISIKVQDVDTVCWWHEPPTSILVLHCCFLDPHQVIVKSAIIDRSSPHFEIVMGKAGETAFSGNAEFAIEHIIPTLCK